ncbi:hypothetical protein ACSTH7_25535, partial [Vibrio parahaemolyticus]
VRDEGSPVEFVNWKGRISIHLFAPPPPPSTGAEPYAPKADATRSCYFIETGRTPTAIFRGQGLKPGAQIKGPAII